MSVPCPKCLGRGVILTGPELRAIRLGAGLTLEGIAAMEEREDGQDTISKAYLSDVEQPDRSRPPSPRVLALYLRVQAEHKKEPAP